MTIDPMSVALCTPTYDSKLHAGYVMGLSHVIAQHQVGQPYFVTGCSSISRARNFCTHWFLKTRFEYLAFVDADIGFRIDDWQYLLEEIEGEDAVCAEYMKKDPQKVAQVSMGLGFVRISRALLLRMADARLDDGTELCARWREYGEERIDFFPQGVDRLSMQRHDEDRGFWATAGRVNAAIRVERRTKLIHYGEMPYGYTRAEGTADIDMLTPPVAAADVSAVEPVI